MSYCTDVTVRIGADPFVPSTGLKQMNNAQHSRDVNSDVSERVRSDVERYINYDLNVLSTWQNECEKIENLSSNIKNDV